MFNIISHLRNANENQNDTATPLLKQFIGTLARVGETETTEFSDTEGGNVKWYGHFGKHFKSFL